MTQNIAAQRVTVAEGRGTRTLQSRVRSRAAMVAVASIALATAVPALGGTATAATTPHFSYTGSAYGTWAKVGSTVRSGPSAYLTFGCTTNGNLHKTNTSAGLSLAPLGKTGTVSTTGDTYASPVKSRTTAATAQVNLLNGLVKATAVKAASSTTRTSTGYSLSSSGTTLTGLVVAGKAVSANTAPNTRINLAGFGYVIVNEQIRTSNGLTVNGLNLFVTVTNSLGVPVGSRVAVSQAVSALTGPVAGVLGGYAYGTTATVGTVAKSDASFPKYMPCLGTGNVVRTNTGAGVAIGTAVSTGTITNTAQGSISATSATGKLTSTVQSANVINGLVKATAIKASARSTSNGSTYSHTSSGSGFGTLSVTGHPTIGVSVAPNTKVELKGVGTLYLHRVIRTTRTVEVRMMELVITTPVNGLAVGTNIKIGVAKSTVS
ncbi:MAG: hypothetical protein AVDCRST_MAG75-324 [uncultured Propionibacteriaceae bacterium]|uniref:Uncharacterized protein n=1 Tax=uncultured Propionibacteriaceae bacterium TaxID=257457 RepID=A0A6J4N005_9ACTN|nr:MAG: hypothetical protein AVDCRST_MAG75-324 [uncultured Propionibacteriaceae bacterium]